MSRALEAVVVRQLAALRRANWSLGDALEFVHSELPASSVKARVHDALGALRAGTSLPTSDVLLATLSRGDAASSIVLEQLADALDADHHARVAATMVRASVSLVLCVCAFVVMRLTGPIVSTFSKMFIDFGSTLPAPTRIFMDLAGPVHVAVPVALVVALVAVWRMRFDGVTGGRELRASSLLLQFAGAVEAGLSERAALALIDPRSPALRLDPAERIYLSFATTSSGSGRAAQRLGLELGATGARLAAQRRWWTSPAVIVVVIFTTQFVAGALIALYLPIFTIASAIK